MNKIIWNIPLKTVSESNCSEHWTAKSKRHRQQQFFIRSLFNREGKEIPLPCEITLTRISPRALDAEDNLPMAFKWIKDEIGACLFPEKMVKYVQKKVKNNKVYVTHKTNKGHSDSDLRVSWKYSQEKGKTISIRIEIQPRKDET